MPRDLWFGDRVAAKAEAAAVAAARQVVDDAIPDAVAETPRLTGAAAASVRREDEDDEGRRIRWGYHVAYGIWIEIGANGRAGVYALRRAADTHYGRVFGLARRRFGRG